MFPTKAEKERSRRINDFYKLFRGRFREVLRYFRTPDEVQRSLEVIINMAGGVCRKFADLLFLEEPIITVSDNKAKDDLAEIVDRNDLSEQLYESALAQSYAGVTYFEVSIAMDLSVIQELNPETVFWRADQRNIKGPPKEVIIAFYVKIDNKDYIFKKIHTPGRIDYELWETDSAKEAKVKADLALYDATLPEYELTGVDEIPVFKIDNQKPGQETFGISDLEDILSLLEELTRDASQVATQLKKHADAKMAVPPGVLDENGKVENQNLEMIEVAGGGDDNVLQIPQYIVNSNPQLENAIKWKEDLQQDIARVTEMSALLMDLDAKGGVEKVGALRLRILPTEAKIKRKRKPYRRAIRKMLAFAYYWQTGNQLDPKAIDIKFSTGLPEDPVEKANVESIRITAGIQTKRDAIRNLDGLEGKALEDKLKELQEEDALAMPSPLGGNPPPAPAL